MNFATALRESFRSGYTRADLRADLVAGITVGVVAVPLAMALAIASGVAPQHGLYTAIVAGAVIAFGGGSRYTVAGPTAAFVIILHPISVQFGLGGLLVATFMAGIIQMAMGVARMGRLIEFIPHPVTTGFTAGIAVVIFTLQLQDLFGVVYVSAPGHTLERLVQFFAALPSFSPYELAVGAVSLAAIVLWARRKSALPPHLVGVLVGTVAAFVLMRVFADVQVATVGSRFGDIPRTLPAPLLPWNLPGTDGLPLKLDFALFEALIRPAFAIALLGAIESLLCGVVTDGMTGSKHDPNAELVGQGLGNVVAPFFAGFAATGALARSATNVRAGARSPLSAAFHALFVLLAILVLAPVMRWLPMAALAGLLCWVAWNMAELKHFGGILRRAPKSDIAVLLTCFFLTVFFDMVLAVGVGIVLAALLFMQRMSAVTGAREVTSVTVSPHGEVPPHVCVYEVAGPLFFGAAERAMNALSRVDTGFTFLVLDLDGVPAIDMTGMVALESSIARMNKRGVHVALVGIQPQPARALAKAGIVAHAGLSIYRTAGEAIGAQLQPGQ